MRILNRKSIPILAVILTISFFSIGINHNSPSTLIIKNGNLLYLSHTLVVKLKSEQAGAILKNQSITQELNNEYSQFKFAASEPMFKVQTSDTTGGLNRIMVVTYNSNDDPLLVASKIRNAAGIQYAEPKYVRKVMDFTPNDSLYALQYNLALIQAAKAWDVTKGDTSVVIGIVDTGIDWMHPDLYANIWHNWKDINSNWSDNDGFKYDSIGWDFGGLNGTPDSNPMEDKPFHGTSVAGVASAVTNDARGVAGIGFNCKLMAVKAAEADQTDSNGEPYIIFGDEGIKYAADNGAKIINCSWGGSGYSQAEQDLINYAISKGALVVAAAGNDGTNEQFYPAAYNGVLAVAATDQNDVKATYSNYGTYVGVAAPGNAIISTWDVSSYNYQLYGTSFASPLTAGVAALVASRFPSYTPLQIAQQIRVNCDNIDAQNPGFKYMLGAGRINAYKAVSNTNSESVRASSYTFSDSLAGDKTDGVFEPGEAVGLGINFTNYLRPVNNLSVTLQSMSPYVKIINGTFSKSGAGTLTSFDNYSNEFTFSLADSIPPDYDVVLKLNYSDGDYSDFQLLSVNVNPSYATQTGNNVAMTITSKGNIGFNDYPVNLEGSGFSYINGPNLLFEGALIMGTSSGKISDEARGADQNYEDTSFQIVQPFRIGSGPVADVQGSAIFNDNGSGFNKLGITTKLQTYTYTTAPYNNFIILRYSFTNTSGAAITNLYTGLFFDWDMVESSGQGDVTQWDSLGNLGYAYHIAGNPNTYVGTALISSADYGYWGIMNDGSDGSWGIYNGFLNSYKWQAISSGIGKPKAGPGDISEVTSGGPFTIQPGQTIQVGFAVAAGNSVADLRTDMSNARGKYQSIITSVNSQPDLQPASYELSQNYPNPFNPSTVISYQVPAAGRVLLKVYDILGNEVATLVDGYKNAGRYDVVFNTLQTTNNRQLSSGIYFYRLTAGNFTSTKKMILLK